MSDFVCETRSMVGDPCEKYPTGFVTEVRPSSRPRRSPDFLKHSYPTKMNSESTFPKDDDNLQTALNDILSKKSLSIDEITLVMRSSLVKLINTLLSGYNVEEIQGCISVALAGSKQKVEVNLNEDYRKIETTTSPCLDFGSSIKLKPTSFTLNQQLGYEQQMCDEEFVCFRKSPPSYTRCDIDSLQSPPLENEEYSSTSTANSLTTDYANESSVHSFRRISQGSVKSDDESGYSSNERESPSFDMDTIKTTDDTSKSADNATFKETSTEQNDLVFDDATERLVIDVDIPSIDDEKKISETFEDSQRNDSNKYTVLTYSEDESVSAGVVEAIDKDHVMIEVIQANHGTQDAPIEDTDSPHPNTNTDAAVDLSGDCHDKEAMQTGNLVKSKKLSCKKCPAILSDTPMYEKHALECHQLHICPTCFKDFSSKNNLKRHVRIHTGSRPYKCSQCDMAFARKDDLKGHTLKHDFNKPFRCSICKKGYTDRTCVKNHMSKEHCSRLMRICPQCGESFDREDAFLDHKKCHESLKQFSCHTCPFIGTNTLMALKHKLIHTHKLFACKPCNAYFADPFDYTRHVRKHKKSSDYLFYVCCFCNIVLPTYEQFVRHEYSHAQTKLHECNVCKKQFKSKSLMLEHTINHSDSILPIEPDTRNVTHLKSNVLFSDTEIVCVEGSHLPLSDSTPTTKTEFMDPKTARDESVAGEDYDQNEILDLSMKPRLLPSSIQSNQSSLESGELTTVEEAPSQEVLSLSNFSVPRNGCAAIDTRTSGQEPSFHNVNTTELQRKDEFQIVWQSPTLCTTEKFQPTRCLNLARIQGKRKLYEEPQTFQSNKRQNTQGNIRLPPLNKMVDFAQKYLAARGGQINQNLLKRIETSKPSENSKTGSSSPLPAQVPLGISSKCNILEKSKEETIVSDGNPCTTVIGLSGKPFRAACSIEKSTRKHVVKIDGSFKRESVEGRDIQPAGHDVFNEISKTGSENKTEKSCLYNSKIERYECSTCNAPYESFPQLDGHSVTEHSRYLCEFCGKGFTARPNRDRHVRYHTGERPYKCDLCSSAFFRGDDLKYHRTTRHPTDQFECNKCAASFAWRKDLDRHLRHAKCVA